MKKIKIENFAKVSEKLQFLTDKICKMDILIGESQNKIADFETSASKKLFGFSRKKN